jgi:hypothetical protein
MNGVGANPRLQRGGHTTGARLLAGRERAADFGDVAKVGSGQSSK